MPTAPPSNKQIQPKKVSFAPETKSSNIGMNDLLDGQYNEAESHAGFLEALNAWRVQGKPKDTPTPKKTDGKVDIKDVQKAWQHQQDKSKKGSFFANIDSGQTNFMLDSIPTWQEGGTQPDKKLVSNKESCW